MEDQDFERIEKLCNRLSNEFGKKLADQSADFHRWLGVQGDDLQHKLNLVGEGQQLLVERMDRMESRFGDRFERLERRVDAVAADLSAHRKDTEAPHGVYCVKED